MNRIALIGCGNMGYALLKGMLKLYSAQNITVCDKNEMCVERAAKLGVEVCCDPCAAVQRAKLIILAVKPDGLAELAAKIKDDVLQDSVIVSIIAGKKLSYLEDCFGENKGIIRVMPNTPALVGCGMSGICANSNVSKDTLEDILGIFSCFGKAKIVAEELMDVVTGVSGSGPAYAFMFIDGMMKSGIRLGMSESDAKLFAAQTVLGAAKMVLDSELTPDQLKKNVCSPGGTTIEAVKVFEQYGLDRIIDEAITACAERSEKMSRI